MLAWLWNMLFYSCLHEWETTQKNLIMHSDDVSHSGIIFVLTCKKCGDVMYRKIMA